MKKFISLIALIVVTVSSSAQNYESIVLVFNDSLSNNSVYDLQDILNTDTVKTNNSDITITGFICSSICYIDWSVKHQSNILSSTAKNYIKNCAKKNNSKVYFDNIMAINEEGRLISLGNRVIRIKVDNK